MVKPVALSGSRGVMRADDAGQFVAAFDRLRALLRLPDIRAERNDAHERVLVEGFIPGREFALEGLLASRALHVLALFDKPDPLDGPFFEETIYVTPSRSVRRARARRHGGRGAAAAAIGLRHGPIHAECRVNDAGRVRARSRGAADWRPVRPRAPVRTDFGPAAGRPAIAAFRDRSSGASAQPDRRCSLEELLLRHALGESPDGWSREARASGVMMIPIPARGVYRGVSGVDAARLVAGVDDVTITAKPDQLLVPLPEGASYLGFIFAHGGTSDVGGARCARAHARLQFAIEPELRVLQSAHGAM